MLKLMSIMINLREGSAGVVRLSYEMMIFIL